MEAEAPTTEQLAVLNRVAERVLEEFRLDHEGLALAKNHPQRTKAEAPLLAPQVEAPAEAAPEEGAMAMAQVAAVVMVLSLIHI